MPTGAGLGEQVQGLGSRCQAQGTAAAQGENVQELSLSGDPRGVRCFWHTGGWKCPCGSARSFGYTLEDSNLTKTWPQSRLGAAER